jgi:hypothetical protein
MNQERSLNDLWNAPVPGAHSFEPDGISSLPDASRRYLEHAIAPGTSLAFAVRLRMHGEIKLGQWLPFTAEQVIHWGRGFLWKASVRRNGVPIRGFDRLLNGQGVMRWKLLGLIPVMSASGPDVTRSSAGRMMAESYGCRRCSCARTQSGAGSIWCSMHGCLYVSTLPTTSSGAKCWRRGRHAGVGAYAAHGQASIAHCPCELHDCHAGCLYGATGRLRQRVVGWSSDADP